ncbi:hypothetical protein CN271_22395 [Bacillus cereus]|uniref:hypothetical protein n=1 Tax=Bacillus cereus TaxID=1396 RepID=UPI000BECDE74|nr:hypothetical protein [Bacillus cereus]PEE33435.1 hypothetical protein CON59_25480 [Bacillus cereus]PET44250.1 hypothetical protein CN523_19920 [Bacillus cereus]PFA54466.1 hypothetical protein CN389_19260 [Bacillus cereus]PFD66472.1 hypothetical protein CN271_22395 [Bacillus cereus]PFE77241.1 hypothetical protein CN319_13810 [Bacillus cereus]
MKRKTLITAITVIAVIVIAVLYFFQLNNAIGREQLKNKQLKDEITSLKHTEGNKTNELTKNFITAFFTYDNTLQRYQNIKQYTTEQGYKSTFPSGMEPPSKGADIRSSIDELEIYSKQKSKSEITTVSIFEVTTTFNEVPSVSKMVIKTDLVKVENGWKIDDVTILSSQSVAN